MPVFIGVHKIKSTAEERKIREGWKKYKEECARKGMRAVRAYYNKQAGLGYCETRAQSKLDVKKAHIPSGMMPEEIIKVKMLS